VISWIVDGVETSLDDGSICYFIGDDGLGMPPMHRLSERGPLQHGDDDRGYRLDPRFFRLVLEVVGVSREDLYVQRAALIDLFKPADSPGIVRFSFGYGTRQIDCHYVSDMSMPSQDRQGFVQRVAVGFKGNDPSFYDPTAYALTFGNVGGGTGWVIPWVIPWTLGASILDGSTVIDYPGNWLSFPTIRITGPITDPVITNDTTGEKLDFTGTTIASGHYYDIDLRYGYKTVKLDDGTNEIANLTSDSDLATWHLEPGSNSISASGTAISGNTKIEINYQVRYLGV
jgi:Siphovirus-type tail component, C-terminal domain